MLNITGGGEKRATEGKELWYLKPSLIFDLDPNEAEVIEKVEILFK
jgi:cysteate synthase